MDLPDIKPPSIIATAPTEIFAYVVALTERCRVLDSRVAELEAALRNVLEAHTPCDSQCPHVLRAKELLNH